MAKQRQNSASGTNALVPSVQAVAPEIVMDEASAEAALKSILTDLSSCSTDPNDSNCPVNEEGDEKKVNNDLVEAIYQYIKAMMGTASHNLEIAREAYAKTHIKVGTILHEIFFNSTMDKAEVENLNPYKARARSWKSLIAKTDAFLKPSAVRNLLRCAVQDKWLQEEKVDTTGLNYTHLVLLSRLDNGDLKKQIIAQVQQEGWSVRRLNESMPRRGREAPPSLLESLTSAKAWVDQHTVSDEFWEDITTIEELSPERASKRLEEVNDLIKQLNFAMERLRNAKKELTGAANKTPPSA